MLNSISEKIEDTSLKNINIKNNINYIESNKDLLSSNNELLTDNSFNETIQEIRNSILLINVIMNDIQVNINSITNYETT